MKIGDHVKFLNEIGGGKVAGFRGKDIVLVEDEDGFQIPVSVHDVVVEAGTDYDMGRMVAAKIDAQQEAQKRHAEGLASNGKSIKAKLADVTDDDTPESDPSQGEITFRQPVEERRGGNRLSAYLAFVPVDIKEVTHTRFEAYFVNDSNYYLHYNWLVAEGNAWHLRAGGEVEPNTKLYLEEFELDQVGQLGHVAVQMLAYKREKPFLLKPAIDVQFRIDATKFYKLHTFQENDFFERPALLFTLVENDEVARLLVVDSKRMKEQMYNKQEPVVRNERKAQRKKDDGTLVVDLHADELLETTTGMNAADILHYQIDYFKKVMDAHKKQKGQKVVFIHGKGEGVLRQALLHELRYRYKTCRWQDASFQEYGYGATLVTIA